MMIAAIGLGLGLVVNAARSSPLPLVRPAVFSKPGRVSANSSLAHQSHVIAMIGLDEMQTLVGAAGVLVLDARPSLFHSFKRIPGALNLSKEQFARDFAGIEARLRALEARRLVVYCSGADCEDSRYVASELAARGFPNIVLFEGGFEQWEEAGLPVESGAARP
jgi:rhodanese-related sulfurtransferase